MIHEWLNHVYGSYVITRLHGNCYVEIRNSLCMLPCNNYILTNYNEYLIIFAVVTIFDFLLLRTYFQTRRAAKGRAPGFLKLLWLVRPYVCVRACVLCVCVCMYVPAPKAINKKSRERHS